MPKHDWQFKTLGNGMFMVTDANTGKIDSYATSEGNAQSRVDELRRKSQANTGANRRARKARASARKTRA